MRIQARVRYLAVCWALIGIGIAGVRDTRAEDRDSAKVFRGWQASAIVEPGVAKLGERVTYRGRVFNGLGGGVPSTFKWLPPESSPDFTWGKPRATIRYGHPPKKRPEREPGVSFGAPDTLVVEATVQAFRAGVLTIPGLRLEVRGAGGAVISRLPGVHLIVVSVLTPADSNADLRPVRGPLAAPWWERVPWRWVAALAAAVAVGVVAYRRFRRPKPQPIPAAPALDPAAVALAELAALRGMNLPAHGRYAEHAFHLTRIARRFLEAVVLTPLPGDTTHELIAHLEGSNLDHADLVRIAGLLRVWDRVKFARAGSSIDDAARAEQAVEAMIRRHVPARDARAA